MDAGSKVACRGGASAADTSCQGHGFALELETETETETGGERKRLKTEKRGKRGKRHSLIRDILPFTFTFTFTSTSTSTCHWLLQNLPGYGENVGESDLHRLLRSKAVQIGAISSFGPSLPRG